MKETRELLREYAEAGSEEAFQELVERYIDLVFSAASRRMGGDPHRAEEVAQRVFSDLARKAGSLPGDVMLGGWLHRHCCFVASNFARQEARRRNREKEAMEMQALAAGPEPGWDELAPLVDDAIQELPEPDRDAVLLRYMERRDFRGVGARLGVTEDTAQKRVSRALEKLRRILADRGLTLSAAGLGGLLAEHCVLAAPAGWAGRITSNALAGLSGKTGALATLGALVGMAGWKFAAAGAAVALLTAGLWWKSPRQETGAAAPSITRPLASNENSLPQAALTTAPGMPEGASPAIARDSVADPLALRLLILAADTGEPVPNVTVDYRGWEGQQFTRRELLADQAGLCLVSVPRETTTRLELTTRAEGYADTRLLWQPERGTQIPMVYELSLARGTRIGGQVVDMAGNPVAGAKVGFNHAENPVTASDTQSHNFGWIEVETGPDGDWEINRIADEVVRTLHGSASHPDYLRSEHLFVSREVKAEAELRAGEHVFKLPEALVVQGDVVDPEGNPVPHAEVLLGHPGSNTSRKTTTALDGSFEVKGAQPGKNLLTAAVDQFAAATVEFEGSAGTPVRITLQPGKLLRMRVSNAAGEPIAGAKLWLDTFNPRPGSTERGLPVQAQFAATTDEEGRMSWNRAPDQELKFTASAPGYMRSDEVMVRPDGTEHLVILSPALKIAGTVRDAHTGRAVENFKVITGWPQVSYNSGTKQVSATWSTLERFWMPFSGGKFEHLFEEPVISGTPERVFIFKIEAEGYKSHVTREVKAEERSAWFEVELEPSQAMTLTVLLPNGLPAAGTDVLLAGAMQHVELSSGGFNRQLGEAVHTTDERGELQVQLDDGVEQIYAASAAGFGMAMPRDLASQPVIRMSDWGRVEGRLTRRGHPRAGVRVALGRTWENGGGPRIMVPGAVTDEQGRYTIAAAPAGKTSVMYFVPLPDEPRSSRGVPFAQIEIRSGETTEANHAEDGVEIVARLTWPQDMTRDTTVNVHGFLQSPLPSPPADAMRDPGAVARWRMQPEIQAALATAIGSQFMEQPNGTWKSSIVPPGTYTVTFAVFPSGIHQQNTPLLQANTEITIPENFEGEEFDLGELALSKPPAARQE